MMRLMGTMLLSLAQLGCGGVYLSTVELRDTVKPHPNHAGVYLVYYRAHKLLDEFGLGVVAVRKAVMEVDDASKTAVWNRAYSDAAERYLLAHGLVPSDCVEGIVILGSSRSEGGGGVTSFRCK